MVFWGLIPFNTSQVALSWTFSCLSPNNNDQMGPFRWSLLYSAWQLRTRGRSKDYTNRNQAATFRMKVSVFVLLFNNRWHTHTYNNKDEWQLNCSAEVHVTGLLLCVAAEFDLIHHCHHDMPPANGPQLGGGGGGTCVVVLLVPPSPEQIRTHRRVCPHLLTHVRCARVVGRFVT